ncbi:hypothetical protein F2P81_020056 [Scophthalmus maximus]|uniref:Uncharacterized protein n=1 Tax=Scophthalmus maximus TaxID=52904 RepID=A0A6A4S4Z3_SCOMX|nr:hypothetical protein F2P81_020056 [Scophthalmus maximus]
MSLDSDAFSCQSLRIIFFVVIVIIGTDNVIASVAVDFAVYSSSSSSSCHVPERSSDRLLCAVVRSDVWLSYVWSGEGVSIWLKVSQELMLELELLLSVLNCSTKCTCFVQQLPEVLFPCLGALHSDLSCSLLCPFSLAPLHRPSRVVSVDRPSSSYLSQADVSENHDLQVWLLGEWELGPSSDWKPAEYRGHGQAHKHPDFHFAEKTFCHNCCAVRFLGYRITAYIQAFRYSLADQCPTDPPKPAI